MANREVSIEEPASKMSKMTDVFNFVAGNATKIRVSDFLFENK